MNRYEDYYDAEEEEVEKEPEIAWVAHPQEFGCKFCWDNRTKKDVELYFFDKANNMRLCSFCPNCGRSY